MADLKVRIVKRVAKELNDGDVVNLGIGIPTMVADYIPSDIEIILQSENGLLGMGGAPTEEELNLNVQNAGAQFITARPGAMFFDSATSFVMIRGGHVDVTVLGAMEVDQFGNLANFMIPGGKISGMGGAMDLASGARKVIIAMLQSGPKGPKLVKKCSLPLTARNAVDIIVTEMGVFRPAGEKGMELLERFSDYSLEEIREKSGCDIVVEGAEKVIEDL